jgi:tetratricopeptide (TPR) repeat protein
MCVFVYVRIEVCTHVHKTATGKFKEAAEHALKCYEFYCDGAWSPSLSSSSWLLYYCCACSPPITYIPSQSHTGTEGGADTDALTIYGNLLLKRLYPEEAVESYQRCVSIASSCSCAPSHLHADHWFYTFNSALALQPGLYNVWFNLANAYLKLGKKEEAIAALQRTLALNPDVTAARYVCMRKHHHKFVHEY